MEDKLNKYKITAIVLAAGSGKRMNSDTKKQFLEIGGYPLIYYPLKVFEESFISDVVLVCASEDTDYCKNEIVEKYHFNKVKAVTAGGAERYDSVYNGLKACGQCDYVMIHDGARPFIDNDILNRAYDTLQYSKSAVVAMPVKDTIKIADADGIVQSTPNRESLWQMQTPQCFEYGLILDAYEKLERSNDELKNNGVIITDDAMVAEYFTDTKIRLVKGSYNNIKITTKEDIILAERIIDSSRENI